MLNILRPKVTLTISPNNKDREMMKRILDAENFSENISPTEFIRHCIEFTATGKEEIPTYQKDNFILQKAKVSLEKELEEANKNLVLIQADYAKLKTQTLEKPTEPTEPTEDPSKVTITITEKMEKALLIRQTRGRSENMVNMCTQAIKYCIRKPLGDLFTDRW